MRCKAVAGGVVADAVIPVSDIVLAPLETDVGFLGGTDDLVEESDDGVGFDFGDADDGCDETGVEEKGFPAGDWVGADEWVGGCNWFAADGAAQSTGTVGLELRGVEG